MSKQLKNIPEKKEKILPKEHMLIEVIIKLQTKTIKELALGMEMPENQLKKFLGGNSKISQDARANLFHALGITEEVFEILYRSVENEILFNNNLSAEKRRQKLITAVMYNLPQIKDESKEIKQAQI